MCACAGFCADIRTSTTDVSRDPRIKRLQTRRESLARPSKHTSSNSWAFLYIYSYIRPVRSCTCLQFTARESAPISRFFVSSSLVLLSSSNPLSLYRIHLKRNFFTNGLSRRRRCAKTPSDRFSPTAHPYKTAELRQTLNDPISPAPPCPPS